MRRKEIKTAVVVVSVVVVVALGLGYLRAHQRLGRPGVKTTPLGTGINVQVELPEKVLDYTSVEVPQAAIVTNSLPADTSYGQRLYTAPDGLKILLNVVLMGMDRTSLHKPEFCLVGDGWSIDSSETVKIRISEPYPYELPVVRKIVTKRVRTPAGEAVQRGVYIYWYVTDGAISGDATGFERMWLMSKALLTRGVLQRWAYITCFSVCNPGEEETLFRRMADFIAAAVPLFQTTAGPPLKQ